MRKLTLLCTAAILASAVTLPSMAQAASCAQYDPNCMTYPTPRNNTGASPGAEVNRADAGSYQSRHQDRFANRADRAAQRAAMNNREPSGFWPADVAGAAVGTAAGIAVGAVDTAAAIAAAPFQPTDSYAYYNNNGYGGYNGWGQGYAERNGFVCTPGTYFKGADGFRHLCQ